MRLFQFERKQWDSGQTVVRVVGHDLVIVCLCILDKDLLWATCRSCGGVGGAGHRTLAGPKRTFRTEKTILEGPNVRSDLGD